MPTKSTPNEAPPAVTSDDPTAGQNPDPTVAGRQPDADQGSRSADEITSPSERLAAERTERRRQRAAAHEARSSAAEPQRVGRRKRPPASATAPASPKRMTFRDSVSITLISVLAAGGVLGAVLGALSVPGWVIGVLVAGLTVVVSAMLRRYSRST